MHTQHMHTHTHTHAPQMYPNSTCLYSIQLWTKLMFVHTALRIAMNLNNKEAKNGYYNHLLREPSGSATF